MIIRGNTVGTTVPQSDYAESDASKSTFIRNKPDGAIQKAQQTADSAKVAAEAALARSGGTMTGSIDMGGQKLSNVPAPQEKEDAANKEYVDDKRKVFTLSLLADSWTGEGPFTQTVSAEGILAADMPHYGPVYGGDMEIRLAQKEAFALLDDLDTGDGSVTFTCFEDRPESDLTIQLEVNR